MPRKAAGRSGPNSGSGNQHQSDEDIQRERVWLNAFKAADGFLETQSIGLWIAAGIWFIFYSDAAPRMPSLHYGASEPTLVLASCAMLCSGLSGSAPKGTWPSWRLLWHVGWCVVFGCLSVAFGTAHFVGRGGVPVAMGYPGLGMTAFCAVAAVGAFITFPGFGNKAPCGCSAIFGRIMVKLDGIFGLLLARSIMSEGEWKQPYGAVTLATLVLPLGMWSLAMFLCTTEAELLAVVPVATLLHLAAAGKSMYLADHPEVILSVGIALLHACLYLPFPLSNPKSNPFFKALSNFATRWHKLITNPVSGFGDEGD
mmetsp:Transcript_132391/g.264093  ORF Transcript_132391/g.264093 Transcript_132391/m.264093 type:complete len:313 (+) Transcript_132391:64-1002(+)